VDEFGNDTSDRYTVETVAQFYGLRTVANDHQRGAGVPQDALAAALSAIGVNSASRESIRVEGKSFADRQWRRMLPAVIVVGQQGTGSHVIVAEGDFPAVWLEDAQSRVICELVVDRRRRDARFVDTRTLNRFELDVPGGLNPGFYTLRASSKNDHARAVVIVPPAPASDVMQTSIRRPASPLPSLGISYDIHSVLSEQSWGIGDFRDLGDLGLVLALHGQVDHVEVASLAPVAPVTTLDPLPGYPQVSPDPNFPAAARYLDPVFIRVEEIPEAGYLNSGERSLIEWAREPLEGPASQRGVIERRAVWRAKESALRVVFSAPLSYARAQQFAAFKEARGRDLQEFAVWWLGRSESGRAYGAITAPTAAVRSGEDDADLEFAQWLQWIAYEQLTAAHERIARVAAGGGLVRRVPLGTRRGGFDIESLGAAGLGRIPVVNWSQDAVDRNTAHAAWHGVAHQEKLVTHLRSIVASVAGTCARLIFTQADLLFRQLWQCGPIGRQGVVEATIEHGPLLAALATAGYVHGVEIAVDRQGLAPWMCQIIDEMGIPLVESYDPFAPARVDSAHEEPSWQRVAGVSLCAELGVPLPGILVGEDVELYEQFGLRTHAQPPTRADVTTRRGRIVENLSEQGLVEPESSDRELVESLYAAAALRETPWLTVRLADAVGESKPAAIAQVGSEYPQYKLALRDSAGRDVRVENVAENARLRNILAHVHALREDQPT